jgi:hypothetical protein
MSRAWPDVDPTAGGAAAARRAEQERRAAAARVAEQTYDYRCVPATWCEECRTLGHACAGDPDSGGCRRPF